MNSVFVYYYDFQKATEEMEDEENLFFFDNRKESHLRSTDFKNQSSSCPNTW